MYAQCHAVHWTKKYDQKYTKIIPYAAMMNVTK